MVVASKCVSLCLTLSVCTLLFFSIYIQREFKQVEVHTAGISNWKLLPPGHRSHSFWQCLPSCTVCTPSQVARQTIHTKIFSWNSWRCCQVCSPVVCVHCLSSTGQNLSKSVKGQIMSCSVVGELCRLLALSVTWNVANFPPLPILSMTTFPDHIRLTAGNIVQQPKHCTTFSISALMHHQHSLVCDSNCVTAVISSARMWPISVTESFSFSQLNGT